jgi:hypothetical protein
MDGPLSSRMQIAGTHFGIARAASAPPQGTPTGLVDSALARRYNNNHGNSFAVSRDADSYEENLRAVSRDRNANSAGVAALVGHP